MTEKSIEERIKFLTELLKLLWFTFIALGGGIVGLLLKLDNPIKVILLVLGIFAEIILATLVTHFFLEVNKLLRKLDKLNNGG